MSIKDTIRRKINDHRVKIITLRERRHYISNKPREYKNGVMTFDPMMSIKKIDLRIAYHQKEIARLEAMWGTNL